jgi:plasmid stabilization system protein ParE
MKRSVRVLRRAQNDLIEIHSYVSRDRPNAADSLISKLFDALESLEQLADRGMVPRDERLRSLGYRVLIEGEYLVFYKVRRTQVRIYRIVHGRRRYRHLV